MTNQQILTKAIEQALAHGWKPLNLMTPGSQVLVQQWQDTGLMEMAVLFSDNSPDIKWVRELEGIIFNHEFAKALWSEGIDYYWDELNHDVLGPVYLHHLQCMVIADDPIKYLGEHL